jgi:hypothetical protein
MLSLQRDEAFGAGIGMFQSGLQFSAACKTILQQSYTIQRHGKSEITYT